MIKEIAICTGRNIKQYDKRNSHMYRQEYKAI
jgi:hypothetical protein